mmetsp:Transcript_20541/g.51720  ORF Transcript_20541/g.51720 Transcript_20541/m.51720 type:complete len:242 (+) Transcript_20541:111-836(+)
MSCFTRAMLSALSACARCTSTSSSRISQKHSRKAASRVMASAAEGVVGCRSCIAAVTSGGDSVWSTAAAGSGWPIACSDSAMRRMDAEWSPVIPTRFATWQKRSSARRWSLRSTSRSASCSRHGCRWGHGGGLPLSPAISKKRWMAACSMARTSAATKAAARVPSPCSPMWGGYSGDSMAATGPKRSASGSGSGEEGFTRCSSHTDSATSSTRRCAGRHRQAMMLRISVATLGRSASTPLG